MVSDALVDSAIKNDESVQQSRLIKQEQLAELVSEPEIVPWTLADLENEATLKKQQQEADIQNRVQRVLDKERQQQSAEIKQLKFEEAYQEGYEKGFAVGKEEGETVGKSEAYSQTRDFIFPKLEQFEQILLTLQQPYQNLEQHLFAELAKLSVAIAEKVLAVEVSQNSDWLIQAIENSIQQLPEQDELKHPIEIQLNPEDLAFLQALRASWDKDSVEYLQLDWMDSKQVTASSAIEKGACHVKQGFSSISYAWQERFKQVAEEILCQIPPSPRSDFDQGADQPPEKTTDQLSDQADETLGKSVQSPSQAATANANQEGGSASISKSES